MRAFLALTSFKSHAWRGSPCWHRGPSLTTEPPSKKLAFSILRPESLTHPGCELPSPVRSRRVPPGHPALPFHLYLSDSESWSPIGLPIGRRQEPPRQTNLTFSVFTCPTKLVLVSRWTPARCSRPDKSYFLCLYLSNKASPGISLDAGEVLPARQILLFLSLPVQHSKS